MTFRSKYERAADELRKPHAKRNEDGITPQHTASAAGLADGDDDGSEHDAEPGTVKAFRDAYGPPAEYPRPIVVHPEDFRKGPIREGHDAVSPGYEPPLSFPAAPPPRRGPGGWSLANAPSTGPYVDGDCA